MGGFTLVDASLGERLCVGSAKPVNAKVYRLKVKVPTEFGRRSTGNGE